MVDGNLTWRVLSNLLSNACKYSQPHTRVYIDIKKEKDTVILSMKNISRDALNIPAEELMERFVRGDSSRHTEGSGWGLNIAQSLVGLQKGTFSLEIAGAGMTLNQDGSVGLMLGATEIGQGADTV